MRIRARLTLALFGVAAPFFLLLFAASFVADQHIREEAKLRSARAIGAIEDLVRALHAEVKLRLDAAIQHDAFVAFVDEGATDDDRLDPWNLASAVATSVHLDMFAVATMSTTTTATFLSSHHLPGAAQDWVPLPIILASSSAGRIGFHSELVQGNPPELTPSILGVRRVARGAGNADLLVYGGLRLDAAVLRTVASAAGAKLTMHVSGDEPRTYFGADTKGDLALVEVGTYRFDALENRSASDAPARIDVAVDLSRLESLQRRLKATTWALFLACGAFALVAGAWQARRITTPIVELSNATMLVAGGDLNVRILAKSTDEIGTLVTSFNQMTTDLKSAHARVTRLERVAAWREVARQLAHEIKNPLFPMQMAMETLKRAYAKRHGELDRIVDESTRVVLEETRALATLASEFANFARLPEPKLAPVDPATLVNHVADRFGSLPHGVTLDVDRVALATRRLPKILVDRDQVTRALVNLVKNAVEACEASGGAVTIDATCATRGEKEGVAIVVADTGPGFAPEVKEKLFTPYFTTKSDGTGLGLAIVEHIVTEHQGTIDVESAEGAGARFGLWFSAVDESRGQGTSRTF